MGLNVSDLFNERLIRKYSISGPRYTSYPTALEFKDDFTDKEFRNAAILAVNPELAIYIHIPFCHSLCYYCGCNKIITRNKEKISRYVRYLTKEIILRASLFKNHKVIQIHFGGGTPNMLSIRELNQIIDTIRDSYNVVKDAEVSVELDPRETDKSYVSELAANGVNRISMGVQDTNEEVQIAINRVQATDHVQNLITAASDAGIRSINLDLVYGLPMQNLERFAHTLKDVKALNPDRVSLFNYAHMPSKFPAQRKIKSEWLPSPEDKFQLMRLAITELSQAGYLMIGMDHFAKPEDELSLALEEKRLGRNFQGYTTLRYSDLVGFGVSAISSICNVYSQNLKNPSDYYKQLDEQQNGVERGLVMTNEDQLRGFVIRDLMTNLFLDIKETEELFEVNFHRHFADEIAQLQPFVDDGLVMISKDAIEVSENARLLIRNVCMVFDEYLEKYQQGERFSKVI